MPFVPHTEADIATMLSALEVDSIDALFEEIPANLKVDGADRSANGMSEMDVLRLMQERAESDQGALCFLGGGAYEHHIPSAVWDLASRGEYMTAYTPYQAEASQGTLQLIYEYQSMMAALLAMDVSNASLYDGGSALAEAVLMAIRANRKSNSRRVLVAGTVNPRYLRAARAITGVQGITIEQLPFNYATLSQQAGSLSRYEGEDYAALIVSFPNYFGQLEEVHDFTDWAHHNGLLLIAVVNPIAVAGLVPPGQWGAKGADIAVGDGQPLGLPLASGGPYFGFMCCRQAYVRQMPGRIIGKTVDLEGKTGFTLTLQAREQHIRRSKATSNICTNQGLAVTAATIHMALLGGVGLQRVAEACHINSCELRQRLTTIEGVTVLGSENFFHELVVQVQTPVDKLLAALAKRRILAGLPLQNDFPELDKCFLVCVTEVRNTNDINRFVECFEQSLKEVAGQC